jgi:uroporphyrinogen-III synthase
VVTADVYQRAPANLGSAALASLLSSFAAGAVHVITATSLEIADRLLDVATPALRAEFERARWLLPGERIAAGLRARGLSASMICADSAEDHDLVAALKRWRASVSGA